MSLFFSLYKCLSHRPERETVRGERERGKSEREGGERDRKGGEREGRKRGKDRKR